jgi:hypothetical protein
LKSEAHQIEAEDTINRKINKLKMKIKKIKQSLLYSVATQDGEALLGGREHDTVILDNRRNL